MFQPNGGERKKTRLYQALQVTQSTPFPMLARIHPWRAPIVLRPSPAWHTHYHTLRDPHAPTKPKVWDSAHHAVQDVRSGDVLLCGGTSSGREPHAYPLKPHRLRFVWDSKYENERREFSYREKLTAHSSGTLIDALAERQDVKGLVVVSNNAGHGNLGVGPSQSLLTELSRLTSLTFISETYQYWAPRQAHRIISRRVRPLSPLQTHVSWLNQPSRNKDFQKSFLAGKVSLELVPQGTLVERLRAHAAGIPAFYTPTGASTLVEQGGIPIRYEEGGLQNGVKVQGTKKEAREFNGRRYVLETAIPGDVAFIRAWKVDEIGNCVFRSGFHPLNFFP
jgi:3-oxoacid CoA-transferase